MKPAKQRHLIEVDAPTSTQDDTGAEIPGWATMSRRVPASIEPLKGNELLRANAIAGEMDTRIGIDWTPALNAMTSEWRLRYQNVIYNIVSIAHIELRQREIEILAKSGLNTG